MCHVGVRKYYGQWEMRPSLPCCNFHTVLYRAKIIEKFNFTEANSENHVSIEQSCSELQSEKDRWLLVSVYNLSITVEYKGK